MKMRGGKDRDVNRAITIIAPLCVAEMFFADSAVLQGERRSVAEGRERAVCIIFALAPPPPPSLAQLSAVSPLAGGGRLRDAKTFCPPPLCKASKS